MDRFIMFLIIIGFLTLFQGLFGLMSYFISFIYFLFFLVVPNFLDLFFDIYPFTRFIFTIYPVLFILLFSYKNVFNRNK